MPYPHCTHGLQEGERPRDVIRVVLQGVLDGFSHVGKSRKVHDVCDLVLLEHLHEPGSIVQISLDKVPLQQRLAMAIHKIVVNHCAIATLYQELHCVTTDITCPACHQHRHNHFLSLAPVPSRQGVPPPSQL